MKAGVSSRTAFQHVIHTTVLLLPVFCRDARMVDWKFLVLERRLEMAVVKMPRQYKVILENMPLSHLYAIAGRNPVKNAVLS